MFCPKCGKEYDDSFAFCPHCGEISPTQDQQTTQRQIVPPPSPSQQVKKPEPPLPSPPQAPPGKPLSLSAPEMKTPSSGKRYPNASEIWKKLSTKGKVLLVGIGVLILAVVIGVGVAVQNSNKSQDTSTTSETSTTTTETTTTETVKTGDDFLALEIAEGQQVSAGPAAVRGTVKSDCTLTLDSQPVSIDPTTKKFEAVVNINEGSNTLTFNITDPSGKDYTKILHVTGIISPETYKAVSPAGPPFANLNKNPDSFAGTRCKYTGKVVQIMESGGSGMIRMDITKGSYDIWTDTIYVSYTGTIAAVQDNIVTVYGTIKGSKTYESQANYNITLPEIEAKYVDVVQ